MSVESIVEAFARGLAQGFVTSTSPTTASTRKVRQRRNNRASVARNESSSTERTAVEQPPPPTQTTLFDVPEVLAPPFTQAEMERMERVLAGKTPTDTYVPGEGVAPWQGS